MTSPASVSPSFEMRKTRKPLLEYTHANRTNHRQLDQGTVFTKGRHGVYVWRAPKSPPPKSESMFLPGLVAATGRHRYRETRRGQPTRTETRRKRPRPLHAYVFLIPILENGIKKSSPMQNAIWRVKLAARKAAKHPTNRPAGFWVAILNPKIAHQPDQEKLCIGELFLIPFYCRKTCTHTGKRPRTCFPFWGVLPRGFFGAPASHEP